MIGIYINHAYKYFWVNMTFHEDIGYDFQFLLMLTKYWKFLQNICFVQKSQ